MKKLVFNLDQYQVKNLLLAFRKKEDVILFWMHVIKTIITYSPPKDENISGEMIIVIDKMSRIFIQSNNRAFSVNLPFKIDSKNNTITSQCGIEVDSKISSDIISLINVISKSNFYSMYDFADLIIDECNSNDHTWKIIWDLFLADDGYIRLDHDPKNENGDIHPLNHIDIFYSQSTTFKIGLLKKLNIDDLLDVVNTRSSCHFLNRK